MDWAFILVVSTPLALAALGEVVGQRAGVLNIGLEGLMLVGAFTAFHVAGVSQSLPIAVLVAATATMALAAGAAYLIVRLSADQVVVGTAVNFLALGATGIAFRSLYGRSGGRTPLPEMPSFLGLDPFVALTLLLIPAIWLLLFRSRWGLAARAAGEYPKAVAASGFSVVNVRVFALAIGGLLAGLAGAHLALGVAGSFAEGMTAGRGFLAIALVTFGRWQPAWTALAALLLGMAQSLQYSLQGRAVLGIQVPSQLWLALPYVLALLVLVVVGSGSAAPNALGKPYEKEG
jgi:general nucleoside transport system permease protein